MIIKLSAGHNNVTNEIQRGLDYEKSKLLGCKSFVPKELTACVEKETGKVGFFLHKDEIDKTTAVEWLKENNASEQMINEFAQFPTVLDFTGQAIGSYV